MEASRKLKTNIRSNKNKQPASYGELKKKTLDKSSREAIRQKKTRKVSRVLKSISGSVLHRGSNIKPTEGCSIAKIPPTRGMYGTAMAVANKNLNCYSYYLTKSPGDQGSKSARKINYGL